MTTNSSDIQLSLKEQILIFINNYLLSLNTSESYYLPNLYSIFNTLTQFIDLYFEHFTHNFFFYINSPEYNHLNKQSHNVSDSVRLEFQMVQNNNLVFAMDIQFTCLNEIICETFSYHPSLDAYDDEKFFDYDNLPELIAYLHEISNALALIDPLISLKA